MEVKAIVDALYGRLILRDFFGKIVPGSIVLLTLAAQYLAFGELVTIAKEASVGGVALFAGASWIAAFALQSMGEFVGLLRYWPKEYDGSVKRYGLRQTFDRACRDEDRQQVERYRVIREACGNGAMAVLLAMLVAAASVLADVVAGSGLRALGDVLDWQRGLTCVVLLVFFVALLRYHRTHTGKEYGYMERVVDGAGGAGRDGGTPSGPLSA